VLRALNPPAQPKSRRWTTKTNDGSGSKRSRKKESEYEVGYGMITKNAKPKTNE
jgi:hypothetical protein